MRTTTLLGAFLALAAGATLLLPRADADFPERSARWSTLSSGSLVGGEDSAKPLQFKSDARLPPPRLGQWIWTRKDVRRFDEARAHLAKGPQAELMLEAGVWVGTIQGGRGGPHLVRANSPTVAGTTEPVSLVLRLDDSLHSLWADHTDAAMQALVRPLVAQMLRDARATGVPIASVQLDYDCPSRLLPRWAELVAHLRHTELSSTQLWLTSIPVHLDHPAYWTRLQPVIDGHILQLFDTNLPCNAQEVARVVQLLDESPVPFALGVGAFERGRNGRATEHSCWVDRAASLGHLDGFRGYWVFPAARSYNHVLDSLTGTQAGAEL